MEVKEINSMNIEELRAQLVQTHAELREKEENIRVLQNLVNKVSEERDQYKAWWLKEQEQTKVIASKLEALKGIVNAL